MIQSGEQPQLKVIKEVSIHLSEKDLAEKGQQAARLKTEIDQLSEELLGHRNRLRPEIRAKQESLEDILDCIESGVEKRTVEVEVRKDFDLRVVEYLHDGVVIETRELTDDDVQTGFVFEPESAVGTQSQQEEIRDVMREEQSAKTKHDHLVDNSADEEDPFDTEEAVPV